VTEAGHDGNPGAGNLGRVRAVAQRWDVRRFTEDLQSTLDAIRAEGGEVIAVVDHTVVYGGNATAGHWIYWRKRDAWADPGSASQ
jgi:hypothetical protein